MINYLFKVFYVRIPSWVISWFIKKETIFFLSSVAKSGHYKNRIQLSENLTKLSIDSQIKMLPIIINDSNSVVSKNGIEVGKFLLQSNEIRQKASEKETYWKNREAELSEKQKRIAEILKGSTNHKRKFSDGGTLANMKNMLKKPMNTGKWF